ncbi:hypothetical protein RSOLAG1IB_09895 [Rhizoctonia solani AG-1 IB]|uniref:BZIP domain-containing protein n=1 Tax=Thanatephorus cucumeris (strain AG1-IB / isolate 7/3/14) TaxID=1108050 RepID=A0A0B7FYF8_THACB|nr:hypothetical protein RSOLAG1IB_09895 [Rhizoctonia solani AG-1 IB]
MASQSHDSDEEMSVTPPGSTKESKSLSRNAQAQARLRARRKAYVDSLEANVKRLQTIVDAIALNPNRAQAAASAGASSPNLRSPFGGSSENLNSDPGAQQPSEAALRQLQVDNARLRRERDALQVQIDALIGYISRGYSLPSDSISDGGDIRTAGPGIDHGLSPNPGSDVEIEPRGSMTGSPLIQRGAYSQDELDQFLSFNDPNLAFMRYLDLQTPGPSALQVPHPDVSSESSAAAFEPLPTSGAQAESTTNFIQGARDNSRLNLVFRGAEP